MRRKFFLVLACGVFFVGFMGLPVVYAQEIVRYEYKIVPLNSLTPLQKKAETVEKLNEIEGILNKEGLQGWDMVSIFAVRTTFDPNVFFVAMKRPLSNSQTNSQTKGTQEP
ncbi:MAG: DUF4177 domain-containing protein [Synergistaceae bacterium]|jgi:hypothetical protein|nr:DUF4177 domain-containing protein [Synergistaceae bacterium]